LVVKKIALATTCNNEINSLQNWREGVMRQTRQPDEICIVDANSNDGISEALGKG